MSFKNKIQNILNDFSNSTFNVICKLEVDCDDNINVNNLNINHFRRKSQNYSRNNKMKSNNEIINLNNIIFNSYEIKKSRSKSIKKIHDLKNIIDDDDYKKKKMSLKSFMNNYKNLNYDKNKINLMNKNNEIKYFFHYLNNNKSSFKNENFDNNNKLNKNLSFLKQEIFNKKSNKNKFIHK